MAGITLFRSARLEAAGFPFHGFTGRLGGVSLPPFDSLNLAYEVGDDPGHVAENLRRLKAYLATEMPLFRVRQVHGNQVFRFSEPELADAEWIAPPSVEADGIVVSDVDGVLAVQTADCAAVLIADPRTRRVAALHAGWRGTAKGVIKNGVRALVSDGLDPIDLVAVIGPCICARCYEVGVEVARFFPESCEPADPADGRFHCDLGLAVEVSLIAAGLTGRNIDRISACPSCSGDRLFSYRGSGGTTGRGLGFISNRARRVE